MGNVVKEMHIPDESLYFYAGFYETDYIWFLIFLTLKRINRSVHSKNKNGYILESIPGYIRFKYLISNDILIISTLYFFY